MKHFIAIMLLVILGSIIYFSIGFGQNNLNVSGLVPETDANRNSSKINQSQPETTANTVAPTNKENKYLQFFDKALAQQEQPADNVQTIHDKIASYGLTSLVMLISAVLLLLIIRFFDHYLIKHTQA